MTVSAPHAAGVREETDAERPVTGRTYRIGEAAGILGLETYVLRFWESEFPQLVPLRTEKGQRLYTDGHLDLLRRIRSLLHEEGMTIDGARRVLENERTGLANLVPLRAVPAPQAQAELLREFTRELKFLRQLLRSEQPE
jgi:DNA-binding transcriptional MerR regulator